MTVSYQNEVASSTSGGFTRLLLKWRGSLYKLIYRELALFCVSYIAVSLVYFQLLTDEQKGLVYHGGACACMQVCERDFGGSRGLKKWRSLKRILMGMYCA